MESSDHRMHAQNCVPAQNLSARGGVARFGKSVVERMVALSYTVPRFRPRNVQHLDLNLKAPEADAHIRNIENYS